MTTTTDDPCAGIDFETITLKHGAHGSEFHGECCVVEAANRATVCVPALTAKYGAAARFEDNHPSISPFIRAFCIAWNDAIPDDETRTRLLKPFATRILGTKTTDADELTRSWMCLDWLCRVQTPVWLRLAGLTAEAQAIEATARIVDAATASAAQPALDAGREKAEAAWTAARAAVRGTAAGTAVWAAARDAVWTAGWYAAGDAGWTAAWIAHQRQAGDAARIAAGAAALDAAAGDAVWDWDAARAAAGEKLAPTVALLQASAVELLGALCDVGRGATR